MLLEIFMPNLGSIWSWAALMPVAGVGLLAFRSVLGKKASEDLNMQRTISLIIGLVAICSIAGGGLFAMQALMTRPITITETTFEWRGSSFPLANIDEVEVVNEEKLVMPMAPNTKPTGDRNLQLVTYKDEVVTIPGRFYDIDAMLALVVKRLNLKVQ
jgi:hypothetical protein